MPRTLGELAGRDRLAEVAFELFDGAGAVAVGVAAEGVFALEFEQDVPISSRTAATSSLCMAAAPKG